MEMNTKSEEAASGETKRCAELGSKSPQLPSNVIFDDLERAVIMEMRKLYLETLKVDVDILKRIHNEEKMLEPRLQMLYDRRSKLLTNYREKVLGTNNGADYTGQIAHFWLHVLKASFTDFISDDDEKILVHLTDIRSKTLQDPEVKFILQFFFEPNEYFSNSILTKTYFINILPDPEMPLSYDGAEIIGCEGCHIDWKCERESNDSAARFTSFFDFFNPPEDQNDDPKVKSLLENDFDLGSFLKERVIPQAVLFFTEEIIDCQNSDSDEPSDEEIDDNDDGKQEEKEKEADVGKGDKSR